MTPITVLITVAAYFALLIGVSRIAARRAARAGGDAGASFFSGGRRAPWGVVAFATIGAAISGVTFISVPGMVVANSYAYLQMILGFVVGYALIAWVLVPMFYRRGLVSIYGWLEHRFGRGAYRSGAWLFFVSKITGAAVRFLVVCTVLQLLVCEPLGIPFELNVLVAVALIWLYTAGGGVTAVIWADCLKTFCLLASVVLCIVCIAANMGMGLPELSRAVADHHTSRVFFFDDPRSSLYFWKQFVAGIFMAIAMNGLDQDMMQRTLACRDSAASRKNMITASLMQVPLIALFLILGTLLMLYVDHTPDMAMPQKSDELFGMVASHPSIPLAVGLMFVIGLVAAAYSAAGSALTALTTSFSVDILGGRASHRVVHIAMSVVMGLIIIALYYLSSRDAISAVYQLASYTYGPILGLFAFGMITRRPVRDRWVPLCCLVAPAASYGITVALEHAFGYHTGFELLLINAAITFLLLLVTSIGCKKLQSNGLQPL